MINLLRRLIHPQQSLRARLREADAANRRLQQENERLWRELRRLHERLHEKERGE